MEQRCHFKVIGSCSGFHYFLWQGASKKFLLLMSIFLVTESQRARGFRLPLWGNLRASPLAHSGEGWLAEAGGPEAPSERPR